MEILERIQAGTQYRSMMLEAHDDKRMIVEGYAATFNQRYRLYDSEQLVILEQIDSRAFDKTNLSDVILQYNHEGRVFARTRNKTLQVTPNARGLFIRADLSGTAEGRKLYQEIKGGYTDRMSFGFTVAEDKTEKISDYPRTYLRTITRIDKLFDVSAVSIPANDYTEISARAFTDEILGKEASAKAAAEQRERQKKKIKIMIESAGK